MKVRWYYYFRTCDGRWAEYRGWMWHLLPPEDRRRSHKAPALFLRRVACT